MRRARSYMFLLIRALTKNAGGHLALLEPVVDPSCVAPNTPPEAYGLAQRKTSMELPVEAVLAVKVRGRGPVPFKRTS